MLKINIKFLQNNLKIILAIVVFVLILIKWILKHYGWLESEFLNYLFLIPVVFIAIFLKFYKK